MRIDPKCGSNALVSESRGHLRDRSPLREEQARMRVPKPVKTDSIDRHRVEQGMSQASRDVGLSERGPQTCPEDEILAPGHGSSLYPQATETVGKG